MYYPHTGIKNLELMKLSLLLWDRVEYIVPFDGYQSSSTIDPQLAEAAELVARPHSPSYEEKTLAHEIICGLVEQGLPEWAVSQRIPGFTNNELFVFQQKLLPDTWRVLEDAGFGRPGYRRGGHDRGVPAALGLLMMSVLAECCAGSQKQMITDRTRAYSVLTHALAQDSGGIELSEIESPALEAQEARDRLIAVTLKTFNVRDGSIDALIDLRKREEKEPGGHLLRLRHKYVDSIEQWTGRIVQEARNRGDAIEIERCFQQYLLTDFGELREQLKLDAVKLFSRDLLITVSSAVVANAALFAPEILRPIPLSATLGVIGAAAGSFVLGQKLVEYRLQRRRALRDHAAGYLYSTARFKMF